MFGCDGFKLLVNDDIYKVIIYLLKFEGGKLVIDLMEFIVLDLVCMICGFFLFFLLLLVICNN